MMTRRGTICNKVEVHFLLLLFFEFLFFYFFKAAQLISNPFNLTLQPNTRIQVN